ncbi:hypothetical protein ACFYO2_17040 [Streptomyces sp. NPDC006602]|uniref:hypothetical protein n=1 Tax=Streptomyces sp. NPDC006602 TaxID=3364751 RepID=UPI0036B22A77
MKGTAAARWARAGGLLLAFALVGLTTACSGEPSEKELRKQATSPAAESRRSLEEQKLRALIERLTAVEGLQHVLTRFVDSCGRPYNGSIFENNRSPHTLECDMQAVAYFGVRGDLTDVLHRIRAADLAAWGPHDDEGRDIPHAAGTVTYALDYHRNHGRYPDGSLMAAPPLEAPGLRIDWDRPDLPLTNRIEEPDLCPTAGSGIYQRCSTAPEAPMSVASARARYGTVLTLGSGGSSSSASNYFTVTRGK